MIPVSEIYVGRMGEGIRTGVLTIFVRFAGCNFASEGHPCAWGTQGCDTKFAWYEKQKDYEVTVDDLVSAIKTLSAINRTVDICVTGGEPLYHLEAKEFIDKLSAHRRYRVMIESNGSLPIWKGKCVWSLDLKCPSSGNTEYNNYDNLKFLTYDDQLKFVIGNKEDFDFACKIIDTRPCSTNVIFQPAWKVLNLKSLELWMRTVPEARLMVQQHKYIHGGRKRKV